MGNKLNELVEHFTNVTNDLIESLNKKYYGLIVNEFMKRKKVDDLSYIEIPVLHNGLYENTLVVRDAISLLITQYDMSQHEYNSCSFNTLIDNIFNVVRQPDTKYNIKFPNRMAQFFSDDGRGLTLLELFLYTSTLFNHNTKPINDFYGITRYSNSDITTRDNIRIIVSDMMINDKLMYLSSFQDSITYKTLVTHLELECLRNYTATYIGATEGTHLDISVKDLINTFSMNYIIDTVYHNKDFTIFFTPSSLTNLIGGIYVALHDDSFTVPTEASTAFIERILIEGLDNPQHLSIKPTHKLDLIGLRYRMSSDRLTNFDKVCKKLILKGVIKG